MKSRIGRYTTLILSAIVVSWGSLGYAATTQTGTGNVPLRSGTVIAVQTSKHLKVALLTAVQLLDGTGAIKIDHVEIVVCGRAVSELLHGSKLRARLSKAEVRGVRIVACGLTMKKKKIDPKTLLKGIEIVPNGLIEIIRLQAAGYYSITL